MTEAEWLSCTDPQMMLEFFRGRVNDRKLRLFAVACCHRFWPSITEPTSRNAVEVAERYADSLVGIHTLHAARLVAAHMRGRMPYNATIHVADDEASNAAWEVATYLSGAFAPVADDERAVQANLLRCIVGNPFRLVTIDPAWLAWNDGTIPKLAQGIYDERAFDRMPILADALEEAGCTNTDILQHCRQSGEHERGCWVVDFLLGKE